MGVGRWALGVSRRRSILGPRTQPWAATRATAPIRRVNERLSIVESSDKTLSIILDSAIDTGIINLDPQGRVASWNAGAVRLMGWTEPEMKGEPLDRLFPEEDILAGRLVAEIHDAEILGRGGQEGWRIRKDGRRIWAVGEMAPIRDGDGRSSASSRSSAIAPTGNGLKTPCTTKPESSPSCSAPARPSIANRIWIAWSRP